MLEALRRARRPLATVTVTAALAVVGTGCSDDEAEPPSERAGAETSATGTTPTGSEQRSGEGSTTTSTVLKPVPISQPARRKGTSDCADTTPKAIVQEFLPQLKRSKASDTAAVRRSLAMQIKQLRKAQGATVPAPVAAAVYAVSKPRTQRSGAYQGCLQSLVKSASE